MHTHPGRGPGTRPAPRADTCLSRGPGRHADPGPRVFAPVPARHGGLPARKCRRRRTPGPVLVHRLPAVAALRAVGGEATAPVRGIPRFHGGAVGYLGYETARHFEKLPLAVGAPPPMPEAAFLRAEDLAVFDHVTRRLQLLTIHRPDREEYDDAVARIDAMEKRLAGDGVAVSTHGKDGARWEPNVTKGQFHAMVDAAREYIMGGD